jgi:hypothetical protein
MGEVYDGKADDAVEGVPTTQKRRALARLDAPGEMTASRFRITREPVA